MPAAKLETYCRTLAVYAAGSFYCVPVFAEEGALRQFLTLDLQELLTIHTAAASRATEPAVYAPAKITIVKRQQIRDRGYQNLFELLRAEASVDAHSMSHETTFNRIAIRGIEGNAKFLIQLDGFPIGSPAGDPVAVLDNFPLFDAERVEIVFGPASALYGANAFTGVINIVTRTDQSEEREAGAYLGGDRYRYLFGSAKSTFDNGSWIAFSGHRQKSENPNLPNYYDEYRLDDLNDFSGNTVVPAGQRSGYFGETESYSLSLTLGLSESFTAGYHESMFGSPTSTGLNPDFVDYSSRASWRSVIRNMFSRYALRLSDSVSTQLQASYSFYEVDEKSAFNNIFSGYTDGYKYARAESTKADVQLVYDFNDENRFVLGGTVESIYAIPKTTDLSSPFVTNRTAQEQQHFYPGTNNTLPVKYYTSNYTNASLFGQYRRSWTSRTDTIFGIRYDENSRYGTSTNPRLGIVNKFSESTTFKLLYGEAFIAPAPEFTFEHFGSFTGATDSEGRYLSNFFFIPNPDLKPEELKTIEANVIFVPNPNISVSASIYSSRVNDVILNSAMSTPDSEFIAGGFIAATSQNSNVGDLEVYGFDSSVSFVRRVENAVVTTWGNYSYTDGELRDTVRNLIVDLPFVARNKIKVGLTYRYKARYFVSPIVYWIDDTSTDVVDIVVGGVNARQSRGYTLVGLNAGIDELLPGLALTLKIDNLLDERYYNAGTGVNITFAQSPQNPRRATLGLRYEF